MESYLVVIQPGFFEGVEFYLMVVVLSGFSVLKNSLRSCRGFCPIVLAWFLSFEIASAWLCCYSSLFLFIDSDVLFSGVLVRCLLCVDDLDGRSLGGLVDLVERS
jgi:hypothetical protein